MTTPRRGAARMARVALSSLAAATALAALTGCSRNAGADPTSAGGASRVAVSSSDDACRVSHTVVPPGQVSFTVANEGRTVTEFYLLTEDGSQTVAELENLAPGLTRELVVSVPVGSYLTACKPGMAGQGIRAGFTVR